VYCSCSLHSATAVRKQYSNNYCVILLCVNALLQAGTGDGGQYRTENDVRNWEIQGPIINTHELQFTAAQLVFEHRNTHTHIISLYWQLPIHSPMVPLSILQLNNILYLQLCYSGPCFCALL